VRRKPRVSSGEEQIAGLPAKGVAQFFLFRPGAPSAEVAAWEDNTMKSSVINMAIGTMLVLASILFQPELSRSEIPLPNDDVFMSGGVGQYAWPPPPPTVLRQTFGTITGTVQYEQPHSPGDPKNFLQTFDFKVTANCKYSLSYQPVTYLLAQVLALNMYMAPWRAGGNMTYFFHAEKNKSDYPDIMVPLTVTYRAKVQSAQYAEATAQIKLYDVVPPNTLANTRSLLSWNARNETLEMPDKKVFSFERPVGMPCAILLLVNCMLYHNSSDPMPYNTSALAFIDPTISVDPTVMIDYNGTLMSAADMYSIKYNPTMRPVGPVPPGLLLLLLSE
jgi:hypothetical protein